MAARAPAGGRRQARPAKSTARKVPAPSALKRHRAGALVPCSACEAWRLALPKSRAMDTLKAGAGRMKKRILTDKRKDKLADYALNISVASFAVAAFDGTWWGILPAFVGLALFFLLTQEV